MKPIPIIITLIVVLLVWFFFTRDGEVPTEPAPLPATVEETAEVETVQPAVESEPENNRADTEFGTDAYMEFPTMDSDSPLLVE